MRRQQRRRAVINLKINEAVFELDNTFMHVFALNDPGKEHDFTISGMNVGDYLRVSSTKRIALAAGRVMAVTKQTIVMSLER